MTDLVSVVGVVIAVDMKSLIADDGGLIASRNGSDVDAWRSIAVISVAA